MKLKNFYILAIVLGAAIPLRHFIPFLMEFGLDLAEFRSQIYATRIGAFFSADVAISAIILLVFMCSEGKRLGIRLYFTPVLGLLVGVSMALPWFLYLRQTHLDKLKVPVNS